MESATELGTTYNTENITLDTIMVTIPVKIVRTTIPFGFRFGLFEGEDDNGNQLHASSGGGAGGIHVLCDAKAPDGRHVSIAIDTTEALPLAIEAAFAHE